MIVVSVVGFRKMSVSIWVGCRIMSRSRKLMLLLCSKVGVNYRLGCILFMWLCIISGMVCFVLHISSMSSTYLVWKVIFCLSSICFRCVFSRSCRNISATVFEIGIPLRRPSGVGKSYYRMRNSSVGG